MLRSQPPVQVRVRSSCADIGSGERLQDCRHQVWRLPLSAHIPCGAQFSEKFKCSVGKSPPPPLKKSPPPSSLPLRACASSFRAACRLLAPLPPAGAAGTRASSSAHPHPHSTALSTPHRDARHPHTMMLGSAGVCKAYDGAKAVQRRRKSCTKPVQRQRKAQFLCLRTRGPSPTLSPTDPVPRAPTDPACGCWRSILTPWPTLSATGMNTLT